MGRTRARLAVPFLTIALGGLGLAAAASAPARGSASSAATTAPAYDAPAHAAAAPAPIPRNRHILFRDVPSPSGAPLAAGQENFDALDYDLSIRVDFDQQKIYGTCVATVRSLVAGLASIPLDFYSNLTVTSVLVNGTAATYSRTSTLLTVNVSPAAGLDDTLAVTVVYNGRPTNTGMGSFTWTTHNGTPLVASLSEPTYARTWWPCKDTPADKATATERIQVPNGNVSAGNGHLVSVTDNGDGTTTYLWRESHPIATYLVSLTVTNFETFDGTYVSALGDTMPLHFYAYPEQYAQAMTDWSVTASQIGYFASMFGEYPFLDEQYGMAEFPFGGAMEHQTMTSMGSGLVQGNHAYDWVVAHELSHQWWGDYVTPVSWADIWLNEGFATFCEALWWGSVHGEAAYRSYMAGSDHSYSGPLYNPPSLFSSTVYDKGAWVVHMLRGVVGDDDFFTILRRHASDSAYGNVSTAGFQATCESVTGLDLDWFFQEWVYTDSGRPDYRYAWGIVPGKEATTVHVNVRQAQVGPPFKMPIQVALVSASGDTTWQVLDDSLAVQDFYLPVSEDPVAFAFDPDGWVLKYVTNTTGADLPSPSTWAALGPAAPNPASSRMSIPFALASPGRATLRVYDASGRLVATLLDGDMRPGKFAVEWDGSDASGRHLPAGIYFVRLSGPAGALSRKVALLP